MRDALVEHDLARVIGVDGAPDRRPGGPDDHALRAIHRSLVRLRSFDERAIAYHRQGRIGTYAIFRGHEAIQAGVVHALEQRDWIFPTYRESAIGLLRGLPAATILQWWRGHPSGWWSPDEVNVASICVPIASHVPHAAGLAWGLRLKGSDAVAVALFGDGATSEGAFHEGANLAAVTRAPLVLVCNNNQWAISTPLSAQTAAARLADKAVGYGMPGLRVDGHDVLAVYDAVREGVERARAGDGPTFIEIVTYRSAPHATADDPSLYIDPARVAAEEEHDCVSLFEAYLLRLGVLDDQAAAAVRRDALAAMRDAIETAESEPPGSRERVFAHVFADPPVVAARPGERERVRR